ncbi:hypothetical protein [Tsukamurella sp. NPDC003166]|uniref:hypothetical protein n=1 Tax=Tsukamurella sp. NPDC003166 TaxID=3154444 RepID=UPI0033AEA830
MSKPAETETRVIPVAALRAAAGMLLVVWATMMVAFALQKWPYDGPLRQRIAYGAMLAASFALAATVGWTWRIAVGMETVPSPRDARYQLAGYALAIPAVTVLFISTLDWAPWRIVALVVLAAAMIVLTVLNLRGRRRHRGDITSPIVTRAAQTPQGVRIVRVAQPELTVAGWGTRWSVGGAPSGTVERISYGPDAWVRSQLHSPTWRRPPS